MWGHIDRAVIAYEQGNLDRACSHMNRAYLRRDGTRRPRDFVEGPAVSELADRILEIMALLECE